MNLTTIPPPLVTADVIAERFDVTPETVVRWAREGRIPSIRPSRRILRFRVAEVEAALTQPAQRGAASA